MATMDELVKGYGLPYRRKDVARMGRVLHRQGIRIARLYRGDQSQEVADQMKKDGRDLVSFARHLSN